MKNNLNIGLFPISYFPSIEYFAYLIKFKKILFEVQETFPKQTLRNRCSILSSNGILNLTVPIVKIHKQKQITRDIKISYDLPWQKSHQRSIDAAYNSSAYYLYFKDDFSFVFEKKHNFLIDLNCEIISIICQNIGISVNFSFTESFEKSNFQIDDFRNQFKKNSSESNIKENIPKYFQVFDSKFGFLPNLSFLDLLYNEGNQSIGYLNKCLLFNP